MPTAPSASETGALPVGFRGLGSRRRLGGLAAVVIGLPLVTAALVPGRASMPLATPVLLVLAVAVLGALLGGLRVGLPAAVVGAFVLNWFFTPPYGTFAVGSAGLLVVLAVYLGVTVAVSLVVDLAARRSAEADRARAEADALGALAGAALAEQQTLPGVLRRVAQLFGMREVSLLQPTDAGWVAVEAVVMHPAPDATDDQEREIAIDSESGVRLVLRRPELFAADRRTLSAFADVAATALEARRLSQRVADAAASEAGDRMRIALLAAVGHDLRTPLSGVKAAVSSLRQDDVEWTAAETASLLETIEDGADRLQRLVENLLAASRLQAGVIHADVQSVGLEEIVARALLTLPEPARVHVEVPDDLPPVRADVGLAERVLGNVIENALRFTPAGLMVTVRATAGADVVDCDVIDHGPGLPDADYDTIFRAFQRAGDRSPDGLGLGLTVAAGFAEAIGATLTPGRTDGGGLTMRVTFRQSAPGRAG